MLRARPELTSLAPVRDAFVPVMKIVFCGVDMDLLFARVDRAQVPPDLDLSDDAIQCQSCGSWEHADCMSHVVEDTDVDDGIYEGTTRWPYLFRGESSDKIIPLPWHDPEWELEDDVCAACLVKFKAALAAQPLASAWCEDRDALPEQDREALFELLRQHDFEPAQLEMPERDWLELREEAGAGGP